MSNNIEKYILSISKLTSVINLDRIDFITKILKSLTLTT